MSVVNIPFQWSLLQISIFPALSSFALIYNPFRRINCAPVKRPLHLCCGPCSSGSSKQHESMGTPNSCQHFLQVNINPCVSHRPGNGVITGLIGSLFLKSSGADFSTLERVQIFYFQAEKPCLSPTV